MRQRSKKSNKEEAKQVIALESKTLPKVVWQMMFQYLPWREMIPAMSAVSRELRDYVESFMLLPGAYELFLIDKQYLTMCRKEKWFTLVADGKKSLAELRVEAKSPCNRGQLPDSYYNYENLSDLQAQIGDAKLKVREYKKDSFPRELAYYTATLSSVYLFLKYGLGLPHGLSLVTAYLGGGYLYVKVKSRYDQHRHDYAQLTEDTYQRAHTNFGEAVFKHKVLRNYNSFALISAPSRNSIAPPNDSVIEIDVRLPLQ